MSDNPKEGRGGKRPGAGRKTSIKNPVKKVITFEKDTVNQVLKNNQDFSVYVREATEEKLAKENKGN